LKIAKSPDTIVTPACAFEPPFTTFELQRLGPIMKEMLPPQTWKDSVTFTRAMTTLKVTSPLQILLEKMQTKHLDFQHLTEQNSLIQKHSSLACDNSCNACH
jgi:hypothetical protein